MFNVGDVVFYGIHGICKISGIEAKQVGKTAFDYYALNPVFNDRTTLFVPVDNEKLASKMQPIMTKQDVNELIASAPQVELVKINSMAAKQEQYRGILASSDRKMLLSLIKTIRNERSERTQTGKKLNMFDEQMLYKAEQILFNEIAFVLGINPVDARDLITF